MSVRAYIVKNVEIRSKEEKDGTISKEKIIKEDISPLFNLWRDEYVLSIFEKYGTVFSTQNFDIGFVEITSEMWDEYKEDIKNGDFEKPAKKDMEIYQKIDSYLKEHEYMFCNCY